MGQKIPPTYHHLEKHIYYKLSIDGAINHGPKEDHSKAIYCRSRQKDFGQPFQ